MRTDPRVACANAHELLLWALVHDLVAHPLMAMTGYSALSLKLHDATSKRAWPRDARQAIVPTLVCSAKFGRLVVLRLATGFYEIQHGVINHRFVVKAVDLTDAVEQAEAWFSTLVEFIPDSEHAES